MADKHINVGYEANRRVINIESRREGPLLDQEINIRLRPRLIVKGLLILAFLAIIFFAGRWSIDAPDIELTSLKTTGLFNNAATEKAETPVATTADVEKTEPKADPVVEKTTDSPTTAATTTPPPTETKPATTTSTTNTSPTETTAPASNEKIITKYSKVALAISNVKVEIKGKDPTWGKIASIEYTIKNTEEGTVKPDYIMISQLEGYDNDYNKKIPLPTSAKTIGAGKTITSSITVPNGFTYSEATAGKVDDVTISFVLFDEKGTAIASYSKGYDLSK